MTPEACDIDEAARIRERLARLVELDTQTLRKVNLVSQEALKPIIRTEVHSSAEAIHAA